MRESRVGAELLPSLGAARGPWRGGVGLGVGGGVELERTDAGHLHWSGLAWASPTVLLDVALVPGWTAGVTAELPVAVLRRDDRVALAVLPAAWLVLSRGF
jgi:hypothetical protein